LLLEPYQRRWTACLVIAPQIGDELDRLALNRNRVLAAAEIGTEAVGTALVSPSSKQPPCGSNLTVLENSASWKDSLIMLEKQRCGKLIAPTDPDDAVSPEDSVREIARA